MVHKLIPVASDRVFARHHAAYITYASDVAVQISFITGKNVFPVNAHERWACSLCTKPAVDTACIRHTAHYLILLKIIDVLFILIYLVYPRRENVCLRYLL